MQGQLDRPDGGSGEGAAAEALTAAAEAALGTALRTLGPEVVLKV